MKPSQIKQGSTYKGPEGYSDRKVLQICHVAGYSDWRVEYLPAYGDNRTWTSLTTFAKWAREEAQPAGQEVG